MRQSTPNTVAQLKEERLSSITPSEFDRFDTRNTIALKYPISCFEQLKPGSDSCKSRSAFTWDDDELEIAPGLIHPEGSRVVSHGRLVSDSTLAHKLTKLGNRILDHFIAQGIDDVTVFMRSRGSFVEHYVVDHHSETVIWVGEQRPESLKGLSEHREFNTLKEEYWTHVENFPGTWLLSHSAAQKLIDELSRLAVDSATSDGSTSPFSPEQIKSLITFLNAFGQSESDQKTYAVARIWNMIWHARTVNNYGGPDACLDRFTDICERPPLFTGHKRAAARCMFGAADAHLSRAARTWSGRVAYVTEWRNFKAKNEKEWQQTVQLACALVIASLIIHGQHGYQILKITGTMLAAGSAANGYYLTTESQNLGEHAADAATYFQKWEIPEYNMQTLALRNATPQALMIWSAIVFAFSVLVTLF